MLNRPSESLQTDSDLLNLAAKFSQKQLSKHGIQHRRVNPCQILLHVPVETLTGITSYLEPPSLLAVAQVNGYLNQHVKNDNTWRRAFVCQFLGISPQSDLNDQNTLLLRRTESTWRNEFIVRYRFRRRWERSRNGATAHLPVHSTISGMHPMPSNGLQTSSLEYGIVARSFPLTGKILSGYLDASGSPAGLGIGNPNAEFTPNISSCAMSSDGGTAKLVWGSRAGDVLFVNVPRAMETGGRRSSAEVKRCGVPDQHDGAVVDAMWLDVQRGWVITGGMDGRVKVWDAKNATSTWASHQVTNSIIPDSCVKVAGSVQQGYIVAVYKSGDIHLWTRFDFSQPTCSLDKVQEIVIDSPVCTSMEGYDPNADHEVTSLFVDPSHTGPSILVGYKNDPFFYRIQVDLSTSEIRTTTFGNPYFGSTSAIAPFFRVDASESSIILVGDHLGCVSFYAWDTDPHKVNPRTNAIDPLKTIETHADGASITAISWNGLVLASGSVRGETRVFDGMSLELLRSFEAPHLRSRGGRRFIGPNAEEMDRQRQEAEKVRIILLGPERDVLFVGVGNSVIAWKAGPVPKYIKGGVRGRNVPGWTKGRRSAGAKHFEHLTQDIIESHDIMEDEAEFSARTRRALGRELDQRTGMANLGLNEVEAVEYVLMLSRDEANNRARSIANAGASSSNAPQEEFDEGVFEGDFGDNDGRDVVTGRRRPRTVSTSTSTSSVAVNASPTAPVLSSSSSVSSFSLSSGRSSVTTSPVIRGIGPGSPIPGAVQGVRTTRSDPSSLSPSNSSSNQKVQISPPYRAEPKEAGQEWMDGELGGMAVEKEGIGTRSDLEGHYFPPIGSTSGSPGGKSKAKVTKSASPPISAWSTPLIKKQPPSSSKSIATGIDNISPSSPPSRRPNAWAAGPGLAKVSTSFVALPNCSPLASFRENLETGEAADQDEGLRFALELSLAEAKSLSEEDV